MPQADKVAFKARAGAQLSAVFFCVLQKLGLVFFFAICYICSSSICRRGGMVDTIDSKSIAGDRV